MKRVRAGIVPALLAVGLGALWGIYVLWIERVRVRLERHTVEIDKPGLPPEGLRLLHLSDLHFRADGWVQQRKVANLQRILAQEPYDLLLVTGDLIHDEPGFPAVLELLAGLRPRLGAFSCPGNHDYCESSVWGIIEPARRQAVAAGRWTWKSGLTALRCVAEFAWRVLTNNRVHHAMNYNDIEAMHAALAQCGIEPLVNRAMRVHTDGIDLWVSGLDDHLEGRPDASAALAGADLARPVILLTHNPDAWLIPETHCADLVLAGHTHGGQVRLPVLGALHTQGTHLRRRQPAGWFQDGASRMFVSRGLGESLPLRFRSEPHAVILHLVPKAD